LHKGVFLILVSSAAAHAARQHRKANHNEEAKELVLHGYLGSSANHIVGEIKENLLGGMEGKNLESFFGTLHI